jgi:hypothetical protein
MLLNLLVVAVVVSNIWFYGQFDADWTVIVRMILSFLSLVWLMVQFYVLPYLMEQEDKSLRLALRNGLFTALAAPGYTAVVGGLAALVVALSAVLVAPLFLGRPPDIWLAYSDDLLHWTDHQVVMCPRPGLWDSVRVGAAGPPVRTDAGWLVIYHGYDQARVYCLGVALLDIEDPARVLSRPESPILVLEMPWEMWGDVPRVVFSCANLVVGDELRVYYGGGDQVMALASAPLADLLAFLS